MRLLKELWRRRKRKSAKFRRLSKISQRHSILIKFICRSKPSRRRCSATATQNAARRNWSKNSERRFAFSKLRKEIFKQFTNIKIQNYEHFSFHRTQKLRSQ